MRHAITILFLLATAKAHAYELNTTDDGDPLHWERSEVVWHVEPKVLERMGEGVLSTLQASAEAWGGLGGVPAIKVSLWPAGPCVKGHAAQTICWSDSWEKGKESVLAYTEVVYEQADGAMVRADIYINGTRPFVMMDPDAEDDDFFDLQGVMTHEFGHSLGLSESKHARTDTMWPTAVKGDVSKRDIEEDDEIGAIVAYATATDVTIPEALGCDSAGAGRRGSGRTLVIAMLGVVVALIARKKRG